MSEPFYYMTEYQEEDKILEEKAKKQVLLSRIEAEYASADKYLDKTRNNPQLSWTDKEKITSAMLTGNNTGQKSQINSNSLLNLVIDQSDRVVAQMFTGKIQAVSDNDKGKSLLMQTIMEKYIIPKANTQWDMLTKLRIIQMYSLIYGAMPALVTYVARPDYIGPDLKILHPRDVRVQANKVSIEDAEYVFVNTIVTKSFLRNILKNKETVYDKEAVRELLKSCKGQATKDTEDRSFEDSRQNESASYDGVELTTKYERNRWIVYSKAHKIIIRDSENPNKDGELPVVYKYSQPLLDRLYGLSLYDRGISVARARDSATNMYFDSVRSSFRPPVIVNPNGIVPGTVKWGAAPIWKETIPNSIRQLSISPIGTNTFQAVSQMLKSEMMNMAASTDTSVARGQDIEAGKTPEAIRKQREREGARDNKERQMMEKFWEKVMNKMVTMMAQKQVQPIDIELFESDIEKIQKEYPGASLNVFESNKGGVLTVTPEELKDKNENGEYENVKYKFIIDSGSSLREDESVQHEALEKIIGAYSGNPAIEKALAAEGIKLNMGEIYKKYIMTSGIEGADKIFQPLQPQEQMPIEEQVPQEQIDQVPPELRQIAEQLANS
jgi:hypothetical protein